MTLPRQGNKAAQRARDRLFSKDPHCHWCGVVTLDPKTCPRFHPDMATLDHIRPRRECVSFEQYSSAKNHALACLECNRERDRVDVALMAHQKEQQKILDALRVTKRKVLVRSAY